MTSLSATVLRLTVPGVPDIYQGSEGWNLPRVDPDNRRAADFATATTRLRTPPRPRLWPGGADAPQWGETRLVLPPGRYRNLLTGAPVADEDSVGALLGDQPCAVLTSVVS